MDESSALISLSFGGGVQSTALLLLMLNHDQRLLDAIGGPRLLPTVAIFADPKSESQSTYDHIERMSAECDAHGFPLIQCSAGDLFDDLLHAERFASIPVFTRSPSTGKVGMLRRGCTSEYKIQPIKQALRALMGLQKGQHVKRQCHV